LFQGGMAEHEGQQAPMAAGGPLWQKRAAH
jgi:hypothetical protein